MSDTTYSGMNGANRGVSSIYRLSIKDEIVTPDKVRKLFSGANPITFDASTGIIGANIGTSTGSFAAGDDPRFSVPNIIDVVNPTAYPDEGSGRFVSIVDAIASITDAAYTNPYLIKVGPGVYTETTIVLPPYVYLTGSGKLETTIVGNDISGIVVQVSDCTEVSNLSITGTSASTGTIGVYFPSTGSTFPFIIDNCTIGNCETLFKIHTQAPTSTQGTPETMAIMRGCGFGPYIGASTGIDVSTDAGAATSLMISGIFAYNSTPYVNQFINVTGANSLVLISDSVVSIIGDGSDSTTGIQIQDGAEVRIYGCTLTGFNTGVRVVDSGADPILKIYGLVCHNCVRNMEINHPGTTGLCTSYTDESQTFINKDAPFYILNRDNNVLYVSTRTGDYNTIADAIASINPTVTATVSETSTGLATVLISSTGAFTVQCDGVTVTGTDIPDSTTCTYIDANTVVLSQASTASVDSTVTVTFVRATDTNAYNIQIGPGIYTETTLSIPDNVSIMGDTLLNTMVTCTGITMGERTSISRLNITGSDLTHTGVTLAGSTTSIIDNCLFSNHGTAVSVGSSTSATHLSMVDCVFSGDGVGLLIDGVSTNGNTNAVIVELHNCTITGNSAGTYGMHVLGANATVYMNTCTINSLTSGTAVYIENGSAVTVTACVISDCANGLVVGAAGTAPVLTVGQLTITGSTTYDVNIEHPSATGVINGTFRRAYTYFNPSASVSMSYLDPETAGTVVIGSVYMGSTNAQACDVVPLITTTGSMGLNSGGAITVTSTGLSITVGSGSGYVQISDVLYKLSWSDTVVSLTEDAENYIIVTVTGTDNTVTVESQVTEPVVTENILLGRIVTTSTDIEFIDAIPISSVHMANRIDAVNKQTIGAIFPQGSGSLVTATATSAGTIDIGITAGRYFYGNSEFNPSGQSAPATFWAYYHSNGAWTRTQQVSIDTDYYDNGTDLVAVPDGWYGSHSLYLVGDGDTEMYLLVYCQAPAETVNESTDLGLPLPPSYFTKGVVLISQIKFQQGNPDYCTTESERPIFGFLATGLSGTTTSHSELMHLDNDDHPQYVLTNGDRTMTGNLNMGNHNITNVALIDNVDITDHAARHNYGGADPLTTGDPVQLTTATILALGAGPGYALSDHAHSILMSSTGTVLVPNQSVLAANGSGLTVAYGDHTHRIVTAAPQTLSAGTTTSSEGSATSFARSDHVHAVPIGTAVSVGSSNTSGSASTFAASDHQHQGVHSITADGTTLYGDTVLAQSGMLTIAADSTGTITFAVPRFQLNQRFGTGAVGSDSIGVAPATVDTWCTSSTFLYSGSTTNVGSPNEFGIIYSLPANVTFSVRLWDVTNSQELAIMTGLTGSVQKYYQSTSTFTNIPTGTAVVELQFCRTSTANRAITLYCMYMRL